jgi:hypothetical protein
MSEEAPIDRLAEALEAILADPGAPRLPADPEVVELLRIANDLRPGRPLRHGSGRIS